MPSRDTVVRLRNHHVRQNGGSTVIASVAPAVVPNVILVAGRHLEMVLARRQLAVKHLADVAGPLLRVRLIPLQTGI